MNPAKAAPSAPVKKAAREDPQILPGGLLILFFSYTSINCSSLLRSSRTARYIASIFAHIPLIGRNYVNLTQFLSAHSIKPPRQFQPQVIHGLFLRLFGAAFRQVKVYRRADQWMFLAIGEAIAVQQIGLLPLG